MKRRFVRYLLLASASATVAGVVFEGVAAARSIMSSPSQDAGLPYPDGRAGTASSDRPHRANSAPPIST
jgi:hypothetical protein